MTEEDIKDQLAKENISYKTFKSAKITEKKNSTQDIIYVESHNFQTFLKSLNENIKT